MISEGRGQRLPAGGGLDSGFEFFALFNVGLCVARTGWLSLTAGSLAGQMDE
jgi:hypothetical protein